METFEAFGIKLLGQNDLEASPNTNALAICNHLYRGPSKTHFQISLHVKLKRHKPKQEPRREI